MMVKNVLLFAFVLTLSLAKAQTQINDFDPKLLVGFDEAKLIKEAKKEGVKSDKMEGYLNSMRAKYIMEHHPDALPPHKERTVVINVDRQGNQHMQSSYCQNLDFSSLNYSNWTGEIANNTESADYVNGFPATAWAASGINGNNGTPVIMNTDPTAATASTDRQVVMNTPIGALTTNPALAFSHGYDPVCQNSITNFFDMPMVPTN